MTVIVYKTSICFFLLHYLFSLFVCVRMLVYVYACVCVCVCVCAYVFVCLIKQLFFFFPISLTEVGLLKYI